MEAEIVETVGYLLLFNALTIVTPVVLFPKKGANKYYQHIYSLSVTLQHSHL